MIWLVLGIYLAGLIIATFVAGALDMLNPRYDNEPLLAMIIFWPFSLVVASVAILLLGIAKLGAKVGEFVRSKVEDE